MFIRSQDKKCIVNIKSIDTIGIAQEVGSTQIICYNGGENTGITVGDYDTEEDALEVLDMICEFINDIHEEKLRINRGRRVDGLIFNMPQSSEVQYE